MRIGEILELEHIKIPLESTSRDEVISELIDVLCEQGKVHDRNQALRAVIQRERTGTTGIGRQIAVPHAKTDAVDKLVMAIGRCKSGVDFESVDEEPVHVAFLLLSPTDKTAPHIQALTRLSRMINSDDFRQSLLNAQNPRELYELMTQQEAVIA